VILLSAIATFLSVLVAVVWTRGRMIPESRLLHDGRISKAARTIEPAHQIKTIAGGTTRDVETSKSIAQVTSRPRSRSKTPVGFSPDEWAEVIAELRSRGLIKQDADALGFAPALNAMKDILVELRDEQAANRPTARELIDGARLTPE
jgi:hypothetical protein